MYRPFLPNPRSAPAGSSHRVCQLCIRVAARHPVRAKSFITLSADRREPRSVRNATTNHSPRRFLYTSRPNFRHVSPADPAKLVPDDRLDPARLDSLDASVQEVEEQFLARRPLPSEEHTAQALQRLQKDVDSLMAAAALPQARGLGNGSRNTASNLLSLDANGAKARRVTSSCRPSGKLQDLIDRISEVAYRIVARPTVFISPAVLGQYVAIQARLGRPETLPQVFSLYATKPLPRLVSDVVEFTQQNPNRASNGIDPAVADEALQVAIDARNLDAAVGIIENSYATTAFVRSKLVRKALVPASAVAAFPVAAYVLATNFSNLQDTMDQATATSIAFAGILAYAGFTATIGVVAVTTANDQMDRVTWAVGTPLRQRWTREEERAALDRVACAWGFPLESGRRGEEDGVQWNTLREYIGSRGMILDATELMEGFQ